MNTLFDGSPSSIARLYNLIKDGKFFEFDGVASDYDTQTDVQTALYAYLIPQAWDLDGQAPFVLDSGATCADGEPNTSDGYMRSWLKYSGSGDSWFCYNERAYYLVAAKEKDALSCSWDGNGYCMIEGFYALPGVDQLTQKGDKDKWGGITYQNVING